MASRAARSAASSGDSPSSVAILACTDERVVPQAFFDLPLGKIYCVRLAGNVCTAEVAGSLEIAVVRLGCPLIAVLGHTDCTAVRMALAREPLDGMAYEVAHLDRRPSSIESFPAPGPIEFSEGAYGKRRKTSRPDHSASCTKRRRFSRGVRPLASTSHRERRPPHPPRPEEPGIPPARRPLSRPEAGGGFRSRG